MERRKSAFSNKTTVSKPFLVLDSLLLLLKALFEFLAGLFDPSGSDDGKSNRKKSEILAQKYIRVVVALLAVCYMVSVVPLWWWGHLLTKEVASLEAEGKEKDCLVEELRKIGDEKFVLGERYAWWGQLRYAARSGIGAFSVPLGDMQSDVDWPGPTGQNTPEARGSILMHFVTLDKILQSAIAHHQFLDAQLPANCQDLHRPILEAVDVYRKKLNLQKSQVQDGTNLTLFKDEVCGSLSQLIEALKGAIEKGDKAFSNALAK